MNGSSGRATAEMDDGAFQAAEFELWRGCGGPSRTAPRLCQLLRDAIRDTRAQAEQVWAARRQMQSGAAAADADTPSGLAAAYANESQRERNRGDEGGHARQAKPGKLCTEGGGGTGEEGGKGGRKRARWAGEQDLGPSPHACSEQAIVGDKFKSANGKEEAESASMGSKEKDDRQDKKPKDSKRKCFFFGKGKGCNSGAACRFRHGSSESRHGSSAQLKRNPIDEGESQKDGGDNRRFSIRAADESGEGSEVREDGAGQVPSPSVPTKATPKGDVCVEQQELSLLCPLSHRRIRQPVKGAGCQHVQCFDKEAWSQSYSPSAADGAGERICIKRCPICGAGVTGLAADATFSRLLEEAPPRATVVTVDQQYKILASGDVRGPRDHMVDVIQVLDDD